MPWGSPVGSDPETDERVLRSFLVVRIVRGSLFLVFLAIGIVGVEARGWPSGVAVALAAALLLQAAMLVANCRRCAHAGGRHHPAGPREVTDPRRGGQRP